MKYHVYIKTNAGNRRLCSCEASSSDQAIKIALGPMGGKTVIHDVEIWARPNWLVWLGVDK